MTVLDSEATAKTAALTQPGATGRPPEGSYPVTVSRVQPLTGPPTDAWAITLAIPAQFAGAFSHQGGQHLIICGADGLRRSYSLVDAAQTRPSELTIGIRVLPGGAFSEGVVPSLQPGDELDVLPPSGRFVAHPDPAAVRRHVAVAAGSGITPVLGIVRTLLRDEPGSDVVVIYANRSPESVMFLDDLHDLKDLYPERLAVAHVLSRGAEQTEADGMTPRGEGQPADEGAVGPELLTGRLTAARCLALVDAILGGQSVPCTTVDHWYLCGPMPLVDELRSGLAARGGEVHSELFYADPINDQESGGVPPPVAASSVEGGTIRLTLAGRTTEVRATDQTSVLDAGLVVRRDLPFACKGGVCGTCRARVREGTVTMRANHALEADEVARGFVLTCQSVPTSDEVWVDYDA